MDIILLFVIIGCILALGFISELIFKKTGIPDVLILIGIGLMLKYVFGFADESTFGEGAVIFTTFALLFVLFQGSLSIDFRTLINSASSALRLTMLSFVSTVFIITAASLAFGFSLLESVLVGTILGGTSSMVIIPLLQNVGVEGKAKSVLLLESAVSDILCIIFTVAAVEAIQSGAVVASGITKTLLSSFGMSIFMGLIVGISWVFLMEKFTSLSKAYVVNIGIVMILYAVTESSFVAASGPIACLTFGLMLRNSKSILRLSRAEEDIKPIFTTEAKNFYSEISFFLKATFFVYLGILIDLFDYRGLITGAFFTIAIYLIRPFVVRFLFRRDPEITKTDRVMMEVLVPKGLAASVLAQYAANEVGKIPGYEALASQVVSISLSAILMSILLTSILVFLTRQGWFTGFFPSRMTEPVIDMAENTVGTRTKQKKTK